MRRLLRRCLCAAALAAGVAGCGTPARHTAPRLRCTHVWVGPDGGDWARAANWSRAAVPGPRSQACIPRGVTVVVSHGRNRVGAVEAAGGIVLRGGALLLMSSAVASEVAELRLAHAVLGGPGKLIVTRHMLWGPAGYVLGVGSLVLGPQSHSVIAAGDGPESAVLGGDDGTGPQELDSRFAPAPACSRYSPPGARACARHG